MKKKNKNKQATASEIAQVERSLNSEISCMMAPVAPPYEFKLVGGALHVHYGRFLWKMTAVSLSSRKKRRLAGGAAALLNEVNSRLAANERVPREYRILLGFAIQHVIGNFGSAKHPMHVGMIANRLVLEFYKFMADWAGDETEFNRDGHVTHDAFRDWARWEAEAMLLRNAA